MFLYLNRNCFNGIYRTNEAGKFNVPFSGSKTGMLPAWDSFAERAKQLDEARIVCKDFETLLRQEVTDGDFVYLDPPYAVGNRRVFQQYNSQSFGLFDLRRLSDLLYDIDRRGARFVLSYALCKESLESFCNWKLRRVRTKRNVSGFAKHRRSAMELIVSNIDINADVGKAVESSRRRLA